MRQLAQLHEVVALESLERLMDIALSDEPELAVPRMIKVAFPTQKELSDFINRTNYSPPAVNRILSGNLKLTGERLYTILMACHQSLQGKPRLRDTKEARIEVADLFDLLMLKGDIQLTYDPKFKLGGRRVSRPSERPSWPDSREIATRLRYVLSRWDAAQYTLMITQSLGISVDPVHRVLAKFVLDGCTAFKVNSRGVDRCQVSRCVSNGSTLRSDSSEVFEYEIDIRFSRDSFLLLAPRSIVEDAENLWRDLHEDEDGTLRPIDSLYSSKQIIGLRELPSVLVHPFGGTLYPPTYYFVDCRKSVSEMILVSRYILRTPQDEADESSQTRPRTRHRRRFRS